MSPNAPLPVRFRAEAVEAESAKRWEDARAFDTEVGPDGAPRPGGRPDRQPFTIVIPPPNITGRLHMGHALNNTIQDVLIRYRRMDGRDALWVPGTDHAGISTQTVVRKHLDSRGVDYRQLGREAFIERVWEWRHEYGSLILNQLRKIGCSCDFRRTRFTMDEGLSLAVRTVFKALYDRGLVYRGKRVVNWCPVDRTALSDDEVETAPEGEPGHLYRIAYPLADDPERKLVVATTRPETMFGDVAVAVHPEDDRHRDLIGRQVRLPLVGRVIPVIADAAVERDFGTGCLKITPAHDPLDFEIGERHGLVPLNVMHDDASLNDEVPAAFRGLDRSQARQAAVAALEEAGLLEGITGHRVPLGRAQRSGVPIEHRLSDQWFVRMRPLADQALRRSGYEKRDGVWEKVREGELRFHPRRWEKVYARWLIGIRDWTISRQIWWGHRIPAWHHRSTGEVLVDLETPEAVQREPDAWRRDEDVLDTWFSSWLWPMSTLGWPAATPDLERYFPTSVLSTDKGILFFWVARMNFAALAMTGKLPYRDVYIHPTVLDEKGAVMSKSKGNGVDPLAVISGATLEELQRPAREARPTNMREMLRRVERRFPRGFEGVGADALRFTLIRLCSEGQEMRLSLTRFHELGRRFVTKFWNASRFVLLALDEVGPGPLAAPQAEDRWIRSRAAACADRVRGALDRFDFASVGSLLYRFVWNDFCDWYVEFAKVRLRADPAVARRTAATLGSVLAETLHLLHPVMPFLTEYLFQRLRPAMDERQLWEDRRPASGLLARGRFPAGGRTRDLELEERFRALRRLVSGVRRIRVDTGLPPQQPLALVVRETEALPGFCALLTDCAAPLASLGRLSSLTVSGPAEGDGVRISIVDPAFEAETRLGDVPAASVRARLAAQRKKLGKERDATAKRLGNARFVERAAPAVVTAARERLESLERQLDRLDRLAAQL